MTRGNLEPKKRVIIVASAMLVVLTLVAIWQFSAQDAGESSALSGRITQIVAGLPWLKGAVDFEILDHILRKIAHGSVYFVLGIGLAGVMIVQRTSLIAWCVPVIGMLMAMTDEFHQSFVPGRAPSIKDVLIDTVGVCLGMLLVVSLRKCYRKRCINKN